MAMWILWIVTAAVLGFTAVTMGALGVHGFADRIDTGSQAAYQTAVNYHMWHSLAILGTAVALRGFQGVARRWAHGAAACFAFGVVMFSGGIYMITLGLIVTSPAVPAGGLAFMAGWAALAIAAMLAFRAGQH